MSRVLLLSGSRRSESYNTRLLQHLAQRLPGNWHVDAFTAEEGVLPIFDQDLEGEPQVMNRVYALHRRVCAADAMIVAGPEYNGLPTPYLKNLVDWISRVAYVEPDRTAAFADRPVLLCSASTGWSGGAVGTPHARALFGHVGALVMGETISLPYAEQAWCADAGCYLFDPLFEAHIDQAMHRFLHVANALVRAAGGNVGGIL